jgi:hypothetical protein
VQTTGRDLLQKQCQKDGTYTNTINYCNTTPIKDSNGRAQGENHFVWVDCTTNEVLPMNVQDPEYRHPGVSTAGKNVAVSNNPPSGRDGSTMAKYNIEPFVIESDDIKRM